MKDTDITKIPDPKMHQLISFAKSGLRIVAGVQLAMGLPVLCGLFLVFAELLGIVEELV